MTNPFQFANGQLAYNADDLLNLCEQFPGDAIDYLVREDLEKWLAYIGQTDIAQCATNARQEAAGDRQKLEIFLNRCHARSSETTEPDTTTSVATASEKPSFFQVIAQLLISIFYRNKN